MGQTVGTDSDRTLVHGFLTHVMPCPVQGLCAVPGAVSGPANAHSGLW